MEMFDLRGKELTYAK